MSATIAIRRSLAAGLVMVTLILLGCAGEAKGADAPVSTNEVTMPKSYRFAPERIKVAPGTTVTFRNTDNFTHSVRLRDGSEPDHLVKPGEQITITFARPGTYPYECSLHPNDMRGTVIVAIAAPAESSPY